MCVRYTGDCSLPSHKTTTRAPWTEPRVWCARRTMGTQNSRWNCWAAAGSRWKKAATTRDNPRLNSHSGLFFPGLQIKYQVFIKAIFVCQVMYHIYIYIYVLFANSLPNIISFLSLFFCFSVLSCFRSEPLWVTQRKYLRSTRTSTRKRVC